MQPTNYDNNPFFNPFGYMSVNIPDWKHIGPDTDTIDVDKIREQIIENLQQVYDPEIPINIFDIGLVYKVDVSETGEVDFVMTLTTPNCPSAQELPEVSQMAINVVPNVKRINFQLTFDPPWNPTLMTEDAKLIMLAEHGVSF